FQDFHLAAPLGQIGSVRAYHIEPRFVEELTKSRCARTLVPSVGVAVGFNANNSLDHGLNRLALRVRVPIGGGCDKSTQTTSRQGPVCHDQRPESPPAPHLKFKFVRVRTGSVGLGAHAASQPTRYMRACPV